MNDQHATAQELSVRAAALLEQGHSDEAERHFAKAAKHEATALAAVPVDKIRTRSILSVSVASLLYKGAQLDEAERIIFRYLAPGDLATWADTQLRELLHIVSDERLLKASLARRYSGESISLTLRGGEIGAGTGPLDLIIEKVSGFRSLLCRVAEWVGKYPLRHQGPPPKELKDLFEARATEPAMGSYRLEIRLTEPIQPDLFEPLRVPPAEVSDRLFDFLECLTKGNKEDLEASVPESDYRKALLQLTRNIVPSGKRIGEIGIYRAKRDRLQSVYLNDALPPKIKQAIPRERPFSEEHTSHRGVLRAVHLDQNWLALTLEDGSQIKCDTVAEMLDDVVGPMVNKQVLVSGTLRQKRQKKRLLVSEVERVDEE
jgi:hypothetical protein